MDVVAPVNNVIQETEISFPNDKPSSDVCDLESEERLRKKPKVNSDDDLKRVAEIIMVLSAMGKIRAGRNPSAAEKGLMVEAREKLAEICESLAPKDLLSRDAVRVVMEDLGLQKVKEPWAMDFRPSKLSIFQRLTLSKRKMEEAQKFASQASHTSRMHTVSLGANPDGQGVQAHPGASHRFPLDKPNPTSLSSGNFQTTSPVVPVSAMPSVSALNPPSVSSEVQAQPAIILMNASSGNSAANDSHSFLLPRTEAAHFILEQPYSGPSYLFPVRANTSGDNLQENTPSSSQTPSVALQKVSVLNKGPDTLIKSERSQESNTFQVPPQALRDPNPKAFAVQTAPFQGVTYVQQPSSFYTPHNDIARNVQKILQPKVSDQPEWIPPSIDYMNRPMTCEVCKLIINDVESLLVCDACEKGVHIKCLQSFNQKVIPKGEWHCLKCVAISNGRPLPPKYGRVSRNAGTPRASMASSGIQAFSDKKVENSDQKIVHHQRLLANGNRGLLAAAQSANVGNSSSEPTEDIKTANKTEPLVVTSSVLNVEEGACTRTSDVPFKERAEQSCLPHELEENGNQTAQMKVSTVAHNPTPKVEARSLSDCSVGIVQSSSIHVETLSSSLSDSKPQVEIDGLVSECQKSEASRSTSELHRPASSQDPAVSNSEVEQTEKEGNHVTFEGENVDRPVDNRSLVQNLPVVAWVGDIVRVIDEKIYHESCSINGVVFKLQDYVLFASNRDNLLPSKLQSLWEDSKTKLKWAILNKCFFPDELPEVVGRPCTPETNEVYESNHSNVVAAHLIRAPCQVLPPIRFEVESEKRKGKPSHGLNPIFLSKWFYDESKGLFRPVTD